jgi:hypothetical protein
MSVTAAEFIRHLRVLLDDYTEPFIFEADTLLLATNDAQDDFWKECGGLRVVASLTQAEAVDKKDPPAFLLPKGVRLLRGCGVSYTVDDYSGCSGGCPNSAPKIHAIADYLPPTYGFYTDGLQTDRIIWKKSCSGSGPELPKDVVLYGHRLPRWMVGVDDTLETEVTHHLAIRHRAAELAYLHQPVEGQDLSRAETHHRKYVDLVRRAKAAWKADRGILV